MRNDFDFTNSHLTRQIAIRPGFDSGKAIAISLPAHREDKLLITRFEVAALITLDLVAIAAISVFRALA
jgi:hypothetical protein